MPLAIALETHVIATLCTNRSLLAAAGLLHGSVTVGRWTPFEAFVFNNR